MRDLSNNRIWLISDIHFGVRSNSIEWIEIQKDYFNNFFIPLLKKEYKEGDILWVLGDVFDNRQNISVLVLNEAINIFYKLSKILPIHILAGNHDIYYKTTNEVNSILPLSFIHNIKIYTEPEYSKIGNRKIFIMPWRKDIETEKECLIQNSADILFCHTGYNGDMQSKYSEIHENLSDVNDFLKYKRVYSGHIHYRQKINNITLIGCPFEMTRADLENEKGIYLLDLTQGTEQFFLNDYSPKFKKIEIEELCNMTEEEFFKYTSNNFIDVLIDEELSSTFPFEKLTKVNDKIRRMDFKVIRKIKSKEEIEENEEEEIEINSDTIINFNINKMMTDYLEIIDESADNKKIIKNKINEY